MCLFACFVYGSSFGVAGFAGRHQIAWAVVAASVVLDEMVALGGSGSAPMAQRARYKYLLPKFLGEVSTGWHLFHSSLCADLALVPRRGASTQLPISFYHCLTALAKRLAYPVLARSHLPTFPCVNQQSANPYVALCVLFSCGCSVCVWCVQLYELLVFQCRQFWHTVLAFRLV